MVREPSSAARPRRRRWAVRGDEEDAEDAPAVLVLSHFSRPPFLSFGSLRVGASRTRLLGFENPNAEDVEVAVDRFPASTTGFSIERRRFAVQSGQRIYVSVTWTPLEEGKVRELVTFIINDIVKHQAVLLGVAEQPLRKKKSLWDTIKKKNSSEAPASVKIKRSTLRVKNINKTFQVSQKVDRLRSPLQPCENQDTMQNNIFPGNDTLLGSENKLPISPITPVLEECHNTVCTPLAMRRSTTFSDIAAAPNEELLPQLDSCNVKKLKEQEELKSGSAYSSAGLAQLPVSNGEVILDCTLSPACTPEHSASVPALSTRRILSPDSFVNDSYQVDIDRIEQSVPILSPDQFVKDNLLDKQSKTPKLQAALVSYTTETYVVKKFLPSKWKKKDDVETKPDVCIEHNLREFFEVHNVESQLLHYDKPQENHFRFPCTKELQTQNTSRREQPKKRPILSATVIKSKPCADEEKRIKTLQPKSKKCLGKAIMECSNVVPVCTKDEISRHLPVIGPISADNKCSNDKVNSSPTGSASLCCKRKSEIYVQNSRGTAPAYVEEVERKRALTSSVANKTHTTVRPPAFKPANRERAGQRKKAGSSLHKASRATNRMSKPIPGLAQSHLTFMQPVKTAIPRHPIPFAAKNMFYDERWKEKQQRGFTWWLNFVLTPDDLSVKTNTSQVNAAALVLGEENHHKTSVPKAPTKDEASLKAYTAHRKLNKLRRDACRLFTSESMVKAIKKLEVEIETRRLLVRRDRHLWKDVGERQKLLNWLLSYNPLWLRIGLETVYGELIALDSNSDVMGLAIFILNRLLWNPDIAAEYRHPTVPHLYREGHEEALSKFTLKKLLLLICFLDCAKRSRIIDHDPCLFCKDSGFKASKDLLLAFSRDFLSGEGDLSRHLGFLGLPVSHVQTPLDEFDFAVTNLAVDLQCGIRLVRTVELLTKNWNLSKQLRVPAISRLQKMHNVDIVLNVLKERGIHLRDENGASIDSRDIVDRHRERTLALLWKIVFAFQVDVFLNVEQLKEEIEFLKNARKRKTQLSVLKTSANRGVQEDNSNTSPQSDSESMKLLMAWVNAVCGFYNIKVENFTVCFSDGRVLCHLIHHYHPCYVPLEAVCQRTTQTVECSRTHRVGLNSSSSSSSESDTSLNVGEGMFDQTVTASVLYKELLDNERKNFQLVNAAVSDLGGIPAMIHHSDMSNTIPDEKVVVTYLSFLCSRLLDLRQETRAARLIQSAWRNYRLKRELKLSQERDRAARIIQRSAMNFLSRRQTLKKVNAAFLIQKHWRRYLARMIFLNLKKAKLEEARSQSAIVIQAYWRRYSARKKYLQLRHYVIFVQARIRMVKSVAAYKRIIWATVTIQSHLRASKLAKKDRQRYEMLKSSALTIQSAFRRWRKYKMQQKAALVLQSAYRGMEARKEARVLRSVIKIQSSYRAYVVRKRFKNLKDATVKIQALVKMRQAHRRYCALREAALRVQRRYRSRRDALQLREDYRKLKGACIRIQAAVRGHLVRKQIQKWRQAAVFLQAHFRMKRARQEFLQVKKAAVCLQAAYRGYKARKKLKLECRAAIKIQTAFRARAARMKYKAMIQASTVIQRWYRACKTGNRQRLDFLTTRAAVLSLQAAFHGWQVRKQVQRQHVAATKIQSAFRKFMALKRFRRMNRAVLTIQKHYRAAVTGQKQRQEYVRLRQAVVHLQAVWRGRTVRKMIQKKHNLAIVIQSSYRMHVKQLKYKKLRQATLVIQKYFRAYCMKKKQRAIYLRTKAAVLVLQAAYHGMTVRKQLNKLKKAATAIQAAFKSYLVRKDYERLRSAAIVVQRRYRATIHAKCQRQKYLSLKKATVKMQAIYRGRRVRQKIHGMHQAAICIQATFRMHQVNVEYQAMRVAAITIQRQYRAFYSSKVQRKKYLELKRSVITLQAACRGMKVRQDLKTMHRSAAKIQSYYRRHKEQRDFRALLLAARRIQRWFRACKERNAQVHNYLMMRRAALCIQAAFRGWRARRLLRTRSESARLIQRRFRTFLERKRFLSLKTAAILIQRTYRATKLSKIQRKKYLSFLKAAVTIQSAYRGFVLRKRMQQMHQAATVIQATLRMRKIYISYQDLRFASVTIQQRYRAYREGKRVRETYLKLHRSVVVLQAAYRGMRTRCLLKKRHQAALTIQRNYRRCRECRRYRKVQWATQVIQERYRANNLKKIAVQRYSALKKAATVIQKAFQDQRAKRHREMHCAAVVIQKNFKAFRERQRYLSLKAATLVCQRRYRALILSRQQTLEYVSLCRATLRVQAVYRGLRVRKSLEQMHLAARTIQSAYKMHRSRRAYQNMRTAAIVIQNHYRAYVKGKNQRKCFLTLKNSALVVQASYRGMRERQKLQIMCASAVVIQSCHRARLQRAEYSAQRQAVVIIQSAFRGMKARKTARQIRAARKIQSFLQMVVQRRKFIQLRTAAVTLQAYYLMCKTRSQYRRCQKAAVVLQRHYRSHLTVRHQRMAFLQTRRNVVIVQARVRGFIEKKRFRKVKESTIKIQAFFRGFIQRQKYLQCKFSAVVIQQHYRAHQMRNSERQRYQHMRRAAIRIQASYRGYKARQWVNKVRAAQVIQTWFRGCRARKEYTSVIKATRVIQSHFKTKQQRTWFLKMKFYAIIIQRRWRATLAARRIQHQFLRTKNAAVKIQLAYRQYRARRVLRKKIQAACLIQKAYRGFKARRKLIQQKAAALTIQKHLRACQEGRLQFVNYNKTRKAVIKLQAFIRGYLVRKKIAEQKQKKRLLYFAAAAYHHISAIKIQRAYRIHLTLKFAQDQISSVLTIQMVPSQNATKEISKRLSEACSATRCDSGLGERRNRAAARIQRSVRAFLARRRRRRFAGGIIKFQALWRGYSWRKHNDTAKTKALRHSLEKANEESREENKLCNRTAIAIEYLLKYKHISYILVALKHLEVATRLSPLCCENMAQSRAIFTIFVLIRSCNRSVPCMDVIRYSIQVLLNVSKYERTTQAVYEVENSIDTLLDLLQMYRGKAGDKTSEKGGSIFTKTCCLLAILSKDSKRALEIRSIPRAVTCIQSLYKLTARKHKMDAERTLVKQKTNPLSGTLLRIKTVSRIEPDWVLRKDNMHEIVDPLQAITMVMDTLGITCY